MKKSKNYFKRFKVWLVVFVLTAAAVTASSLLICRTQIIEDHRYEEQLKTYKRSRYIESFDRESDGESEQNGKLPDADRPIKQITPLSNYQKAGLILLVFCLFVDIVWYWLRVAFWLRSAARGKGFENADVWFVLAMFTNIFAVAAFAVFSRKAVACRECGNVQYGGKFCGKCGAEINTVCRKCGKKLPPDAEYCRFCGEPAYKNKTEE